MRQRLTSSIRFTGRWPAWWAVGCCLLSGCQSLDLNLARGKVGIEAELAKLDDEPDDKPTARQAARPASPPAEPSPNAQKIDLDQTTEAAQPAQLLADDEASQHDSLGSGAATKRSSAPADSDGTGQDFSAVIAELQSLGAIDPLTRQRLIDDLKKTDPALWPPLIQYFRASLAERRDGQEREPGSKRTAAAEPAPARRRPPVDDEQPLRAATMPPLVEQQAAVVARELVADIAATYAGDDRHRGVTEAGRIKAIAYAAADQASTRADQAPDDWRSQLNEAIAALEVDLRANPLPPEGDARPAQLRFLYLAAGQRDAALKPADNLSPALQQFWSEEFFGLATYLETDRIPDAGRRAAEASRRLGEAAVSLGETAALVVRNLAFCTEIKDFGLLTRFDQAEFKPGDKVLLYAEVENFKSVPTSRGYHTSLTASYQVFDAAGRRVDEHEFPATEEHCQNRRRDFFIPFVITLPSDALDGRHTLRLTIEDTLGHKIGQSSLDFTIRGKRKAEAEPAR